MSQKFVMVAAEDVHVMTVGSLKAFQHRRRLANEPAYREAVTREQNRPRTLSAVLGLDPVPVKAPGLVVNERHGQFKVDEHPVFRSMSEMLDLAKSPSSMMMVLGLD